MKFVKQTFRHDPDNGVFGDCYPTCLSILTGIHRHAVPHWHEALNFDEATSRYDEWLNARGMARIATCWTGDRDPDAILEIMKFSSPLPFVFSGVSRNGTNHCVIAQSGRIIWDPALDDSGIIGPMKTEPNEVYMGEWIIRPVAR